jgi:hypothetical protein
MEGKFEDVETPRRIDLARSTSFGSQTNNNNEVWVLTKPTVWQRLFAPKAWQQCWGINSSPHPARLSSRHCSTSSVHYSRGEEQSASTLYSSDFSVSSSSSDDEDNNKELSVPRRYSAARSSTNDSSSIHRGLPPMAPSSGGGEFGGPAQPHYATPNRVRAVSYASSTTSKHRRDSAVLPPIEDIVAQQQPPQAAATAGATLASSPTKLVRVPSRIDPAKFSRSVSNLDEDDADSDIEDGEEEDDAIVPPPPPPRPVPSTRNTSWMQDWVNGIRNDSVSLDGPDKTSDLTSSSGPQYLPTTPVPAAAAAAASSGVAFRAGWAAVVWNAFLEDASTLTESAIFFVQLLNCGTLQLIPWSGEQCVEHIPLSDYRMSVSHASDQAGDYLSLVTGDTNLCILPVHLPESTLVREDGVVANRTLFVDADQSYAPTSQHDATLHMRFAMDAALRCHD